MAVGRPAAYLQLALVGLAFAILTHGFIAQDFSQRYVAENSNSLLPMIYRYTAVWGAHEGSLLLWALILALWTAAVACSRGTCRCRWSRACSACSAWSRSGSSPS
jgi:cytochrome c-type biogenesis protein CcmF